MLLAVQELLLMSWHLSLVGATTLRGLFKCCNPKVGSLQERGSLYSELRQLTCTVFNTMSDL